jgi:5'-nucleotidase
MKILLVNDDGIKANGILELADRLKYNHEIYIVAPSEEKSASSSAITIRDKIKFKEIKIEKVKKAFEISALPADCTKLALNYFFDKSFDLVISGINRGANLGLDIRYSGTVAAAMEAIFEEIPAISFSLDSYDKDVSYKDATLFIKYFIENIFINNREKFTKQLLNINIPNIPYNEFKGIKITRENFFTYKTKYEKIDDEHLIINSELIPNDPDLNSDYTEIKNSFISITPLNKYFSNKTEIENLKFFENIEIK